MPFYGKIGFALIAGLVILKLLAMMTPEPKVHEVWVGTQCPGGKTIVTSDIEEPELRKCKDAQLHSYKD